MADGLSVIASVAGIISLGMQVTQSLVDYYESYKGQKSEVAHTTRKLEHLLSVFGILQQQSTARANEPDLFESIDRSIHDCKEYIHELQRENEKFEENPANGMRAAARTATRRLAYPFRQSTLQKLDEDIDEIVSHRSLALQVLEQKGVGNVQDDIEDVKSLLNLVRAAQVSSNIRQWLKAPDASINYNEACKKKHPGTGLWFVRAPCFSTWLVEPNSFLWLNGFAGCGKSVLCSTAIQHAFRHRRSNTRFGIAFFFFTFNDDSKQNTSAMLRALVLQLSGQLNDNNGPISGLYESYCNFTPPGEAFVDCLQQLVQAFKDVYTILDALDESPPNQYREDVLQTLTKIRAWKEPGLHLLVTSRDATDIREELGASPDETISMKNESVDRDIATFISHHLRDNRRLRKWSEHYDQIETVLTSRAKGMFRWVECQFKALISCPQCEDLLDQLLGLLPQSLDETYERMLLNITPSCVKYARRILTLLCCAKRPLTIPELIDGIAVEIGEVPKFNPKRKLKNVDAVHQVCPGLIEVDMNARNNEATVRIAHFSVQEYLESERVRQHKAAIFSVKRPEAHTEVARICLTYLLEFALLVPMASKEEYPLALYAGHQHYHDGDEDQNPRDIEQQILRLFQSSKGELDNWLKIWNVREYEGWKAAGKVLSPVYYAALLGLDLVVSQVLCGNSSDDPSSELSLSCPEHSDLINPHEGEYGSCLAAASAGRYEKIVKLLLDKGADVNANYRSTALRSAAAGGHKDIAKLLLSKGADVNAASRFDGSPLEAASVRGDDQMIELLVNNSADPNIQRPYSVALTHAATRGNEKTVLLLLEKGVNPSLGYPVGALYAAMLWGHTNIIKLLLSRGADINGRGREGNVLQAALSAGREDIVQLLISKGADVNAPGGKFGCALMTEAARGHEKHVQILLDNGADVNVTGHYGTPLKIALTEGLGFHVKKASSREYQRVAEMLISKGATE